VPRPVKIVASTGYTVQYSTELFTLNNFLGSFEICGEFRGANEVHDNVIDSETKSWSQKVNGNCPVASRRKIST
jgi:hypothetical protein